MLSGRRPFESDTPAETMAAVLRDEPPSLDPGRVPQPLADMVRRCLSKDRNTRFASATQMLPLFDGVAGGSPLDSKEWTRRSALGIILAITLGTSRSASRTMIRDGRAVDRTIRVGSGPCALAFGDGHVWVTNRLSNTVTKIRIADGSVAGTYAVGDWPVSIAWAAQAIWVANHKWLPGEYSTLMKIDPTSGRVLETFRLPGQPMHLTADATHLWVTETWPTYLLRKIRLTDGVEVAAYTAGGVPRQACSDGESVWVSNGANESLTKVRASDGKVVGALSVPGLPNHLERTGDHLWLNNHHPDAREAFLLKITAADLTIVARFPAPGLIAHAVSDRWLFASEVSRIVQTRISDGSVAAMWAASPRPEALIFDGVNLWAADQESDSVTMIKGQSLTAAAAP
jgi:hypothetical protein